MYCAKIISKEMKKMNKHEKIKITIWADGNVFCILEKLLKEKKLNYKVVKSLSAREIEVLRLLMEGETDSQIADELNLSIETVHTRVKNILAKTGYTTRTKLAVAVRVSGFIINS